ENRQTVGIYFLSADSAQRVGDCHSSGNWVGVYNCAVAATVENFVDSADGVVPVFAVYACLALARLFVNPCYPACRIVEILGAETAWICYKAKLASEIVFVRNRDSCFDLGCAGKSSGHVVFV